MTPPQATSTVRQAVRTPSGELIALANSIGPRLQQTIVDPRRLIRWIYVGRFSLATAIFIAAQFAWDSGNVSAIRIASLIFAATMIFTGASAALTEVYRAPLRPSFLYGQTVFDLALVTAIVHITGSGSSQFAALYILVIANAAVLLPTGGALLVALLGIVGYFADVLWLSHTPSFLGVWLQLFVFATVALGSAYISARLRETGAAGPAAQLAAVRLQAEDVLRNIRSGIVTIDRSGHLLYANPAASALLGIPFSRLVGRPILASLAEAAPQLARALERAATERVRTTRAEEDIRFGDHTVAIGVTTTFSDSRIPSLEGAVETSDDRGGPAATATAIFQDISGQKRLESLHIRASRLEAIAELSASLAHEIKNPLASIQSAVEQLAGMLHHPPPPGSALDAGPPDEDARTLATLIVRESDRLARILTEFLDFARVRVTRITSVDIGQIVREAARLAYANPSRQEGVTIACTIPDAPVLVDGDDDLLHRAVFNLVLNAVQAVEPGRGRVCLEVTRPPAEELPPGVTFESRSGAVAIGVIDNGPGIDPAIRDRLFHPFMTTKSGGSGLGLSVVQRAIEAHRGYVLVDTGSDGEGTRFTILLPERAAQ